MKLNAVIINNMHADYMSGMSLAAVGRKYNRNGKTVRGLFVSRGLHIRPTKYIHKRLANGQIAPLQRLAAKEIDDLIRDATKLKVPAALKQEWRRWSLKKRAAFIERLRVKLGNPNGRPDGPFSSNVEPFDYGSPKAWEIANRLNEGLSSQNAKVKIDICSQGVIYCGELWFWSPKTGYMKGPYSKETGRRCLHHAIWEKSNDSAIPRSHVVRFVDGNWNNLSPENLKLESRDTVCRENQAAALQHYSRETTKRLLERSQGNEREELLEKLV